MKQSMKMGLLASAVIALGLAPTANAKVDAATAAKLGKSLTGVGAEANANAAGTIPAYKGGITSAPACYKSGDFVCSPFPDDKPKFVITADNMGDYKANLTAGQMAMFEKYPKTYRIPVYETKRTVSYPERVLETTKENALNTTLSGDSGMQNFSLQGYPFPIPDNGLQVIWNHIGRWRGDSIERIVGQVTPQVNGSYSMVMFRDQITMRNQLTDYKPGEDENVMFYFKQQVTAPSRLAGNVLLVHETIDQVAEPRRAWIYNAGQRRVRRAPQVAYDGPGTASDGLRTSDNFDMFNGSPDRYDWKLVGKKEVYIPYNSYKLEEKGLPYDDMILPGHINQDLTRYELHRVWVVEATLKPNTRHIYAKRTFYIDEDSWLAAEIDHYDGRGNLWRVAEGHQVFYYDGQISAYAMEALYDLNAGRYLALGFENNENTGPAFETKASSREYQPAALRREGVR